MVKYKKRSGELAHRNLCKKCENQIRKDKYYSNDDYRKRKNFIAKQKIMDRYHNDPIYREGIKKKWRRRYHLDENFRQKIKENKERNSKDPIKKERALLIKRKWEGQKRKNDPKYRISSSIRGLIYKSIRQKKNGVSWEKLVGFTLQDLTNHLEDRFCLGMSWNNYGKWHIDHIKPISMFNFTDSKDEDFKKCWSLNNLQPLWASENCAKQNRYIG